MALNLNQNSKHDLEWMVKIPIAHRCLHDAENGLPENSISAAIAAVEAGYNIEIDLQPSVDRVPMVFHDLTLDRMTQKSGDIRALAASEIKAISLIRSDDMIPSLEEFLKVINGRVGLVIELKGKEGQDEGFVKAVGDLLSAYDGEACIMSFEHHILRDAKIHAPDIPLGLTAYGDDSSYEAHKSIAEACEVDFISYELKNLDTRFVREFRQTGRKVISWTVKSPADKAYSDKFADQITFEGFTP